MTGDLFDVKNIAPMLIADNAAPFADKDFLYEIKWDGERCVAYLDPTGGTELRNKRNVRMLPKVPELSQLHRQVSGRCILDGELLCVVDGKPNFEAIQRRSLMSSRHKIELAARQYPAAFIAFDCLYYDGRELAMLPLTERKEFLRKAVAEESPRLAVSRVYEAEQAMELIRLRVEPIDHAAQKYPNVKNHCPWGDGIGHRIHHRERPAQKKAQIAKQRDYLKKASMNLCS